ncbi:NAD(P)/FAD-dependent oxidoreductase [Rhizobium leguminosarum]|uniref:NAD(P)/FAD-dependent oxidoreductase n=1 Tax=Rhizobium leguminosarum TaxID=384 RepID=UPI0021B0B728|nr:FAD-dependent oxidoreductase [Rhizobium leguminosarum]
MNDYCLRARDQRKPIKKRFQCFPSPKPIPFSIPIPNASEVVIIGRGIVGVCTAIFLANRDVQVTLLEKGRIAAEESSRNWGWIRKQGRDADELPIVIEACRLWQQLADECLEDIGLRQTGVTYVARTAKDMAAFEDFMKIAAAHDLDTRLVDGNDVSSVASGMSRRFSGAMTTPGVMLVSAKL